MAESFGTVTEMQQRANTHAENACIAASRPTVDSPDTNEFDAQKRMH